MKAIGNKKSVMAHIEHRRENEDIIPITCEFERNGDITIHAEFERSMGREEVNEIISMATKPIINVIKDYLGQSGYTINEFKSLESSNVEILDIKYLVQIPIKKILNLKGILGCLSSVFSVISGDLNIWPKSMRFKRVANYNEMDSQEAYIIELRNKGSLDTEIVEGLKANFNKSEEEARVKLAGFKSSFQLVQDAFQSNRTRIRNNPGFLTTMEKEQLVNVLTINVSGIDDIWYLDTLPIYIDSLLRITQNPESTSIPLNEIDRLCKEKKVIDDNLKVGIISPSQTQQNEVLDNVAGELTFGETKPAFDEEKGMLDMFGDSDDEDYDEDDYDDEDEDDDDNDNEDKDVTGGANTPKTDTDELEIDLTGAKLSNPNPFFARMKKREPKLFVTKAEGEFGAYSRMCPWNLQRQPVILTDEEKEVIDENHPDSYTKAVKYGSDPEKKDYWYICPRYWSLRDNTSLTEEEVKSGKYGKIIPAKAKVAGKDETIFDFSDGRRKDASGNFHRIHSSPGFLNPSKHKDGKCLPCCFKAWDSDEQNKRRGECGSNVDDVDVISKKKKKKEVDDYIKGPDKFPLGQNRYGYLPIAIEKFLDASNKKCQISDTDTNLKKYEPCILRHGVQRSSNQSFVSCIANVMVDETKEKSAQSIKEMKMTLINALDMDRFMTLQNGNLIEIFDDGEDVNIKSPTKKNIVKELSESVNAAKTAAIDADAVSKDADSASKDAKEYKENISKDLAATDAVRTKLEKASTVAATKLSEDMRAAEAELMIAQKLKEDVVKSRIYRSTNKADPSQMVLLKQVIRSYENYMNFLNNDKVEIDHRYLWDLICQKNPKLFKEGLNMVIMEIKDDDITNDVRVLCPTNHYARSFFDVNKKTILLMKKGNYFEPIYSVEAEENKEGDEKLKIIREFSRKDPTLRFPNVLKILSIIKDSMDNKCRALPSMTPTVYEYRTNIILGKLVHLLKDVRKFIIETQVMNYNGRIIGVVASKNSRKGFIPCFPSAPMMGLTPDDDFTWMDDDSIWSTYEKTLEFLNYVHSTFRQGEVSRVPCQPRFKVIEDSMIVGILTQTNQFVAIEPPRQNYEDIYGLEELVSSDYTDDNYAIVDRQSITSKNVDLDRVKKVNEIRLESSFFNVFRNTVRILLGQFKYRKIRERIEETIASETMLYLTKLKTIDDLLRDLMKNMVNFTDYSPEVLSEIGNITNCYNSGSECSAKKFCITKDDNECALQIPKENLINEQDNETVYYGRMADEVIRYNRIKSFIFKPETFLAFSDLKYNLREDEIILLQSLLTQDYFDNLVPDTLNTYVKYNTYDTAQPLDVQGKSLTYSNKIGELKERTEVCKLDKHKHVSPKWKNVFPRGSKTISYGIIPRICTFSLIRTIIRQNDPGIEITNSELKEVLLEEYNELVKENKSELLQILGAEGKINDAREVRRQQMTMDGMIMNSEYYMTNLDLWILVKHYNLPVVLFSATRLAENGLRLLVANSDGSDKYYFIRSPGRGAKAGHVPKYRLVVSRKASKIPLSDIVDNSTKEEILTGTKENMSLESYIQNFSLSNVKVHRKIKRKPLQLKQTE